MRGLRADKLIVLESQSHVSTFYPLSLSTPIAGVIIGGLRFYEHVVLWSHLNGADNIEVVIAVRRHLVEFWSRTSQKMSVLEALDLEPELKWISVEDVDKHVGKNVLVMSTLVLPSRENMDRLVTLLGMKSIIACSNGIVAAYLRSDDDIKAAMSLLEGRSDLPSCPPDVKLMRGIWDVIKHNVNVMRGAVEIIKALRHSVEERNVDDKVRRHSVIVDAEVPHYVHIEGPCVLYKCKIMPFAIIRGGVVAHKGCVIGGEVKNAIFDAYSRKEHYGYVGDSYVGRLVNLGAGTTVSNLKNTRGTVKYASYDTGLEKFGSVICDWARTAIGTKIYCGRYVGQASHAHGYVYDDVPPFTMWLRPIRDGLYEVSVDKAVEIYLRDVKKAVDVDIDLEVKLMREVYELSKAERNCRGVVRSTVRLREQHPPDLLLLGDV